MDSTGSQDDPIGETREHEHHQDPQITLRGGPVTTLCCARLPMIIFLSLQMVCRPGGALLDGRGPCRQKAVHGPETVHQIYGTVSQNAICFSLRRMVFPSASAGCRDEPSGSKGNVSRRHRRPANDISIGEKAYWGRSIGTACVRMPIDLAFQRECRCAALYMRGL